MQEKRTRSRAYSSPGFQQASGTMSTVPVKRKERKQQEGTSSGADTTLSRSGSHISSRSPEIKARSVVLAEQRAAQNAEPSLGGEGEGEGKRKKSKGGVGKKIDERRRSAGDVNKEVWKHSAEIVPRRKKHTHARNPSAGSFFTSGADEIELAGSRARRSSEEKEKAKERERVRAREKEMEWEMEREWERQELEEKERAKAREFARAREKELEWKLEHERERRRARKREYQSSLDTSRLTEDDSDTSSEDWILAAMEPAHVQNHSHRNIASLSRLKARSFSFASLSSVALRLPLDRDSEIKENDSIPEESIYGSDRKSSPSVVRFRKDDADKARDRSSTKQELFKGEKHEKPVEKPSKTRHSTHSKRLKLGRQLSEGHLLHTRSNHGLSLSDELHWVRSHNAADMITGNVPMISESSLSDDDREKSRREQRARTTETGLWAAGKKTTLKQHRGKPIKKARSEGEGKDATRAVKVRKMSDEEGASHSLGKYRIRKDFPPRLKTAEIAAPADSSEKEKPGFSPKRRRFALRLDRVTSREKKPPRLREDSSTDDSSDWEIMSEGERKVRHKSLPESSSGPVRLKYELEDLDFDFPQRPRSSSRRRRKPLKRTTSIGSREEKQKEKEEEFKVVRFSSVVQKPEMIDPISRKMREEEGDSTTTKDNELETETTEESDDRQYSANSIFTRPRPLSQRLSAEAVDPEEAEAESRMKRLEDEIANLEAAKRRDRLMKPDGGFIPKSARSNDQSEKRRETHYKREKGRLVKHKSTSSILRGRTGLSEKEAEMEEELWRERRRNFQEVHIMHWEAKCGSRTLSSPHRPPDARHSIPS